MLPRRLRECETVEQCRVRLIRQLLAIPLLDDFIVMTDEKKFTLGAPMNPQNERVNTTGNKRDIPPERLLFPVSNLNFEKKLMAFCAISMRGKVCIHIFEEGENEDGEIYRQLLVDKVLPACLEVYPDGDFIFQQDGASPHTAKETQGLLKDLSHRFGIKFISSAEWPPYSPDVNACDYRLWAHAVQEVYAKGSPSSLSELREKIMRWWDGLSNELVRKWMMELRPRMERVVNEGGMQIEQWFNKI